ncbi:MAG: cytochrome c biogenesis protein ResB [Candidatus Omnitrophica bacterium]|nr:cytochrome c biogenesis protein ResB [Candidatus Omnitrophota bacterium]
MRRWIRLLGSLTLAVPLLIAIAAVLAWGTLYEMRFGTAAVQRFIYHGWWFQALLAFLAVNLAIAAASRYPWKRHQLPFLLAHLGIILILVGGIIGGRFGVEGQLVIPEGQAERTLELPQNVLVVHQPNPDLQHVIPMQFESRAWVHEPNLTIPVSLGGRMISLTVDRYYPDAVADEEITDDGAKEYPAVQVRLAHEEHQDVIWFMSRDPERFGVGWGEAHVLFLEPQTPEQFKQLLGSPAQDAHPRGVIALTLPGMTHPREVPVPDEPNHVVEVSGTPYRITFKDYFPDFAMTEEGPRSQSTQPNNPAVSFVLAGPEGADAYMLFALHPDFQTLHGFAHQIPAHISYTHPTAASLPPNCIGLIRDPSGTLVAVLTGSGTERSVVNPVRIGTSYTHPSLGYQVEVAAYYPRARVTQRITNRTDEIRAEAIHVVAREGEQSAATWLTLRGSAHLTLGAEPIHLEYRPAQRELPMTIKLLDFRKIDYPGTDMAAGFESDVELTDPQRGIMVMRKISMNNPLRYRGFSFYQSSYIPGRTEMTVLSVRNDPGTPLVYAGFLIIIAGVVSLFVLRAPATAAAARRKAGHPHPRSRST